MSEIFEYKLGNPCTVMSSLWFSGLPLLKWCQYFIGMENFSRSVTAKAGIVVLGGNCRIDLCSALVQKRSQLLGSFRRSTHSLYTYSTWCTGVGIILSAGTYPRPTGRLAHPALRGCSPAEEHWLNSLSASLCEEPKWRLEIIRQEQKSQIQDIWVTVLRVWDVGSMKSEKLGKK